MAIVASERPRQRADALKIANQVRIGMCDLKREIANGLPLSEALEDPRAGAAKVSDLLIAQRQWGPERMQKLLRRLMISEHRRVRELTDRQLTALLRAIG